MMFRALTALTLLLATTFALTVATPHTQAFEAWCFDDPIIFINGVQQSITVGMPRSALAHLHGAAPVTITLNVPPDLTVYVPPASQQPVGAFPVTTVVVAKAMDPGTTAPVVQTVTSVTADAPVRYQVDLVNGNGAHTIKKATAPHTVTANFTPKR